MPPLKIWLMQSPVHLGRIFFSFLILTQLGNARQQDVFAVRPAVSSSIEAAPGTIVAATFRVTNLTPLNQTYSASLVLPSGWKRVIREFPFEIQAGESDVRLVTFSIPPDAPAQRYEVRYTVRDDASPVHELEASLEVFIIKVTHLEVKYISSPRFVVAGSTYATGFLLTNLGNASDPVKLTARSSYDYPVRLDSGVVQLLPRESREIQVYVTTDVNSGKINHTLELEAWSGQDPNLKVKASNVVEIIPRTIKNEADYLEYPVTVRLRSVGERNLFAPQVELNGYGSLNEQKTDRLEFLFRVRETQSISSLGQRDEYKLGYRAGDLELIAGDQNYSLSPLTEMGRYATGVGGKTKSGPVSAGGFYNGTRWSDQSQKEIGGFLNYQIRKEATLGINYLSKREQFSSDMATLRGFFSPIKGSSLDLEFGTGTKDGNHDNAYSAQFVGNQQWVVYDLRYVRAGPQYGGYYRDINFISASMNFQPKQHWRIETFLRRETRNLARDTNLVYAPRDESYQIGTGYSDYIAVNYIHNSQRDLFDSSRYKSRDDALQTRLGYKFSFASISASLDFGKTQDELHSHTSPYKRFALYTSINPASGKQNYNVSVEYTTFRDLYSGEDQERVSANLNAYILLGETTQAQVSLYGSRLNASTAQTYSMFDASVEHLFPFKHKLSLHGRLNVITPSVTNSVFAYAIEYAIPIGVPIKRITGVGQLRGALIDEHGAGIADVLISAGEQATLTDKEGRFYFTSLKPGNVFLVVDKAGIGLDRITTQVMPMELLIRGGDEAKLTLSVTRSAAITGTISLLRMKEREFTDSSSALIEVGGKPGVFLEISLGEEVYRRVTDSKGRFNFSDLRSGTWILKVAGGDIPVNHNIVPDSMHIDLAPGDKKEVTVQLKPRKRTIQILQEGVVLQAVPLIEEKKNEPPKVVAPSEKPCLVTYSTKRKGYLLQISSWILKSDAARLSKRAEMITGRKTFTEVSKAASLKGQSRVFIGIFKSKEDAVAFCRKFRFE